MNVVEKESKRQETLYRAAHARGDRLGYVTHYERWVAAKCAEGDRPDALRRDQGTLLERFWARVIPGLDDHLVWDSKRDWQGRPVFETLHKRTLAQRFAWRLRHGELGARMDVWTTCGQEHCVNVEHMASAWRARGGKTRIPDHRVLERLRACATQLGRTPTKDEYDVWREKTTMHSAAAITNRFGSWGEAMRKAGLSPREPNRDGRFVRQWESEEMLARLRAFAAELGHVPNPFEWERAHKIPVRSTIGNRFGSWGNALRAAGLGE